MLDIMLCNHYYFIYIYFINMHYWLMPSFAGKLDTVNFTFRQLNLDGATCHGDSLEEKETKLRKHHISGSM